MKRKTKNIIMILICIIMIGVIGVSVYFARESLNNTNTNNTTNSVGMNNNTNNTNEGSSDNSTNTTNSNDSTTNTNDNSQGGTPPDMNNNSNGAPSGTPPEKPDGDNSGGAPSGTPPEKPSGDNSNTSDSNSDSNSATPPEMPGGNNTTTSVDTTNTLDWYWYLIFGVEGLILSIDLLYLFMSGFNKNKLENTDKKIILGLGSIILTGLLTFGMSFITNKLGTTTSVTTNSSSKASGSVEVTSKKKLTSNYSSSESDKNAILVTDGGVATIDGATVSKSGDASNIEQSDFTGTNAAILVESNSSAKISNSKISTDAKGGNGVFATGENAKIEISDSEITTTGSASSRGLDATYGGSITGTNLTISTKGGSCAALATDRGEGVIDVTSSKLTTNGSGSPIIYSTGNISLKKSEGTANGSQLVVIEGKNSATVTDSKLSASGKGNRGDNSATDQAGVMIYQSMSGDAGEGTGTFTAKDSTLTILKDSDYYKSAPMFFITNTDAVINLENTKLSYGSNILISAKGTSEWGNSGSNGGNLEFSATDEELVGNIEIDNISTLTMSLKTSTYKGTINGNKTAKSIKLVLDKDSKITLTGDSYVSSLEDEDSSYSNIDFNGYKLYVNGKAIN